ncbi:MAG: thiolase family protein [Thermodesulfobacteriota bacterium]|nr:thiolase family protein [Thermodesulfobacteriota bacterium]
MREVAVIGVDMIPFGRYKEKTPYELARIPVIGALKDAGIEWKKIEAAYVGHLRQGVTFGQKVLMGVGQTGLPIVNVEGACSSGAIAFREAYLAVASGLYDFAIAIGCEKQPRGLVQIGLDDTDRILGFEPPTVIHALMARRHMEDYGTTREQFAKVSVKAQRNASVNPYAHYGKDVSVEDVLNSRMINDPITLLMCCPTSEGAAAAIVCSMEKARTCTTNPVKVAASSLCSEPYIGNLMGVGIHGTKPDTPNAAILSSQQAYEQAGLGPEDLSFVEFHDAFATIEIQHYEEIGLCKKGEGGRLIDEGVVDFGGKCPVSPSGGLLGKGHPLGATGVAQVVEAVWQLRGQCDKRQVPNAKVGFTQTLGEGGVGCTHLFTV